MYSVIQAMLHSVDLLVFLGMIFSIHKGLHVAEEWEVVQLTLEQLTLDTLVYLLHIYAYIRSKGFFPTHIRDFLKFAIIFRSPLTSGF